MLKAFMIKVVLINHLYPILLNQNSIKVGREEKSKLMYKKMINIRISRIIFRMILIELTEKFNN